MFGRYSHAGAQFLWATSETRGPDMRSAMGRWAVSALPCGCGIGPRQMIEVHSHVITITTQPPNLRRRAELFGSRGTGHPRQNVCDGKSRPFASGAPLPPPPHGWLFSLLYSVHHVFSSPFFFFFFCHLSNPRLRVSLRFFSHDQDDCSPHRSDKVLTLPHRSHTRQLP